MSASRLLQARMMQGVGAGNQADDTILSICNRQKSDSSHTLPAKKIVILQEGLASRQHIHICHTLDITNL